MIVIAVRIRRHCDPQMDWYFTWVPPITPDITTLTVLDDLPKFSRYSGIYCM